MLFSKSCQLVLFVASLLSANAVDTVNLGTAEDYVILAKSGISTVSPSAITGDIAVSPITGDAITGFSLTIALNGNSSTSDQVTGTAFAANYNGTTPTLLTAAVLDMETAYDDASGRPNEDASRINLGGGEIGGQTLTPGMYTFGTGVSITSDVTIDAGGDADAIFIIQMAGNLKVAADKSVILSGGALEENIFWQIAGNVEVGAGASMEGILLVKTDVTFITGSSLKGRVLAQTACVLQKATIAQPGTPTSARRNLRH